MSVPAEASAAVSLTDEAAAYRPVKGPPCAVGMFLTTHPELAAELQEAMASAVYSSGIAAALQRRNLHLPEQTIARHRRGACKCRS